MKTLRSVFDFYISANIHVAVSAAALTKLTLLFFGIHHEMRLLLFVFFATILSYGFIEFFGIYKFNTIDIRKIFTGRKALFAVNVLSALYLIYFSFEMSLKAVITLIPFIIAVVFYVVPYKGTHRNLRSIAGFKLFLIALTWAGVTVIFPLVYKEQSIDAEAIRVFMQRIFYILAIAIPFDIRDAQFDHSSLKTIPQLFGLQRAKILGTVFLLVFLGMELFRTRGADLLVTAVISLVSWLFLIFSRENQNRYYTVFWVEALPVFWLGLYLLFHDL